MITVPEALDKVRAAAVPDVRLVVLGETVRRRGRSTRFVIPAGSALDPTDPPYWNSPRRRRSGANHREKETFDLGPSGQLLSGSRTWRAEDRYRAGGSFRSRWNALLKA